jgi:hypothetical protein
LRFWVDFEELDEELEELDDELEVDGVGKFIEVWWYDGLEVDWARFSVVSGVSEGVAKNLETLWHVAVVRLDDWWRLCESAGFSDWSVL